MRSNTSVVHSFCRRRTDGPTDYPNSFKYYIILPAVHVLSETDSEFLFCTWWKRVISRVLSVLTGIEPPNQNPYVHPFRETSG